jgi:transcription elongation factor Elf1
LKGKYLQEYNFIKAKILTNEFFKSKLITEVQNNNDIVTYNFRCPICGDSYKNSRKKRAYLIYNKNKKGGFKFYCHNCGEQLSFNAFLKELNNYGLTLHEQWKKFFNIFENTIEEKETFEYSKFNKLNDNLLNYVSKIKDNKNVYNYLIKRNIPEIYFDKKVFSYHGSFKDFILNDKLKIFGGVKLYDFHSQISDYVVFVNEAFFDGILLPVGFTLRALKGNFRYYNIPIRDCDKTTFISNIINSDEIEDSPIIITEGAMDAFMFDMPTFAMKSYHLKKIYDIPELEDSIKIFAFDNEMHSHHNIIKNEYTLKYAKSIDDNDYLILWHLDKNNKYKDPNEMVMSNDYEIPLDNYIKTIIKKGLSKHLELKRLK